MSAANDIDRARYSIRSNRGLSLKTTVAFGPHSSIPHFETFNETNMIITDKEPIILDSGGQYNEGTTIVSRTIHFGEPTFEQKKLYTNVLRAIIRMSTLNFPESVSTAEVRRERKHAPTQWFNLFILFSIGRCISKIFCMGFPSG